MTTRSRGGVRSSSDLEQVIDETHRALDAFAGGDAEPLKSLYSRREDVSLANPFGPAARGWSQVADTMERAALNYRDGEATGFERVSEYATSDLAYIVEVERFRAKVGGAARGGAAGAPRHDDLST
jgi:hypothetical protein